MDNPLVIFQDVLNSILDFMRIKYDIGWFDFSLWDVAIVIVIGGSAMWVVNRIIERD